jgi:RNA polymerase sigma factor (sigma-70 family)
MRTGGLRKVLEHLRLADGELTDGQLLVRFLDGHEEAAFAALVRRHGPMVLGVCRRVLRHEQDAEDAFQAAFLVLARKACSIRKRESLGSWLYGVAYHAALKAQAANVRRRTRERQVEDMPHPEVAPPEAQDWRALLDRELERLPEKYRAPIVLCDLECRSRREAARQLGLCEGTLSSRLGAGRRMLAGRLAKGGLSLSGGALGAALAEGAPAAVPAPLVVSTVKAAVLVAAGKAAAVTTPAALLMNEVLKAMLLTKLKFAVAAVMVTVALGASGFVYRAAGEAAPPAGKPANELEALRRENDLLKLNLEVVLEKVRALDAEVRTLKGRLEAKAARAGQGVAMMDFDGDGKLDIFVTNDVNWDGIKVPVKVNEHNWAFQVWRPDPAQEVEAALKAFREARDKEAKRRAADALEKALKKLREQLK